MEPPLYARAAAQKSAYLQPENQLNHLDDRILQLILWTMNNCESQHEASHLTCSPVNNGQHEYSQTTPANIFKNNSIEDMNPNVRETHRKVSHQCLRSSGPPPRPFKKARYAWEIKNYDYTLKKMKQNLTPSENQSQDKESKVEKSPAQHEVSNSTVKPCQVAISKSLPEERTPDVHMIAPPHHHPNYNMGLLSNSYHAHYEAVMGANLNHQNALSHEEQLSTFHSQIPQDPDARLIRWHTRQLCRSIFDNTVNRMLENMGFSPLTERSQALHPLLVLSLSDDEERESEEAHQRSLESRAMSAALHQKGLLPPPYQYDALESATTSDYDSSEEDSELGEVVPDELVEQSNMCPPVQQNVEEDPYLHMNTHQHHPSLAHLVNKSVSYISPEDSIHTLNHLPSEMHQNFRSTENLSDYRTNCDNESHVLSKPIDHRECSDKSQKLESQEPTPQDHDNNECISRCQSLECNREHSDNENSYQKKMKLDDNENCISSPKQETLIEGKVERVLDNCHTPILALDANKNNENNNNDTTNNNNTGETPYFIKNAIHLAIKQQGLGFQRA